jgi:hypothetical protein
LQAFGRYQYVCNFLPDILQKKIKNPDKGQGWDFKPSLPAAGKENIARLRVFNINTPPALRRADARAVVKIIKIPSGHCRAGSAGGGITKGSVGGGAAAGLVISTEPVTLPGIDGTEDIAATN